MIPKIGSGGVLPPFGGDDVSGEKRLPRSPYQASMSDLVTSFCLSPERAEILKGLLRFRAALRTAGFQTGFQWIDGSFVENCENVRGRPPKDVDVVSVLNRPTSISDFHAWKNFVEQNRDGLFNSQACKANYFCDAYFIDLGIPPRLVAQQAAYWFGLFSHQRDTFRWKGLVQLDMESDDNAAMQQITAAEASW